MLTEFALTPGIFDEGAHQNQDEWLNHLVDLGRGLFPQVAVCASVVTNLGSSGWQSEAARMITSQSSSKAKGISQALMKKIDRVLVGRDLQLDWPADDPDWAREASACHSIEPIDRIVAPKITREAVRGELPNVRSLSEVGDAGFWSGVRATASPSMVAGEQASLLRRLCIHSDWVALVNPYCCTTEQRQCFEVIAANLKAQSQMGPKLIELHTEAKEGADEDDRQKHLVSHIERSHKSDLRAGQSLEVYFWPRLRERIFIGGRFVAETGGRARKSPRWGVNMSHIAHETDRPEERTHWSLLSLDDIGFWFERHIAEYVESKPNAHRIEAPTTS